MDTTSPRCRRFLLAALLACPAAASLAQDCNEVASATVEELRAGEAGELSASELALARRAAGAACVKARSDRYVAMDRTPVEASSQAAAEEGSSTGSDPAPEKGGDDDDDGGLWPFGDFKINDVSSSPSKKPYERRRIDRDD